MKRVAWWTIKIVCGATTVVGTLMVVYSLGLVISLLSGWLQPDFETPPVSVAFPMLVASLVIMIVGFKAPTWLGIDRPSKRRRAAVTGDIASAAP
jgi:hypothetical protein